MIQIRYLDSPLMVIRDKSKGATTTPRERTLQYRETRDGAVWGPWQNVPTVQFEKVRDE